MIKIEVTFSDQSKDIYTFHFSQINIGSSLKNDIIIDDTALEKTHFTLNVGPQNLICTSDKSVPYFHHNGKKSKGFRILKQGDIISTETLSFKILDFSIEKDLFVDVLENADQIVLKHPNLSKTLELLEKELVFQENKSHKDV